MGDLNAITLRQLQTKQTMYWESGILISTDKLARQIGGFQHGCWPKIMLNGICSIQKLNAVPHLGFAEDGNADSRGKEPAMLAVNYNFRIFAYVQKIKKR